MSKTIGIVGFGSIGTRHANNALELGCKIKVYDANPSVGRTVDTLDELLTTVDAVVIASPTDLHSGHLDQAVIRNRHILVEKPLAHKSPAWVKQTLKLAEERKLVVMTGNNLRFHTCVKVAKGWLDEGAIGKPTLAHFAIMQYNEKPVYKRDGVILNWGAHEVDLALYLLGPAKVTHCFAEIVDGHDIAALIQLFHKGEVGSLIHLDYYTKPQKRFFVISGDKGSISCDLEGFVAELRNDDGHEFVACEGSFDSTYKDEMQAFIDRIDGKETLGASGQDGLACLELLLEARRLAGLS